MIFHDDLDRKRYLSPLEEVQNSYSCKLWLCDAKSLHPRSINLVAMIYMGAFGGWQACSITV